MTRRLLLTLTALALSSAPALAQQPEREVQVPLAPDLGVLEVTSELRLELGVFEDVPGFEFARLFRRDDGGLVLEVSRREEGRIVRDREPVGEARLAALRAELATGLNERGRTRLVDRRGRSGLVLTETILGLGYYGWAAPIGLDINSDRGQVAAYLLTSGLSFYLPYAITRNASVSVAERNAAVWGGTRGIAHGLILGELLTTDGDPSDGDATKALAGIGMSVAETFLGYHLVGKLDATEGEVAFLGAVGDFGIPFGFGLSYLFGLFEEDATVCDGDFCSVEEFHETRAGYAGTLAISLAAPVLARWTGEGAGYTIGDARALRSFGTLGAQIALPLAWAAFDGEDDPDRPFVAAVLAGSAAGLLVGNRALRSRSLSGGDGLLVMAGHLAGGLGALGITYLLDGGNGEEELLYLSTSAVGSAAGALLMLRAVSTRAPVRTADSGRRPTLEVNPAAAFLPLASRRAERTGRTVRAPLLTLRF